MKNALKTLLLTATAITAFAAAAQAADGAPGGAGTWQLRLRAIDVIPAEKSTVNITGKVGVDNSVVPEFDISYYFTDHISSELILGTSRHDLTYNGTTALGKAMILPPTLTAQYHFLPNEKFNPYVGAGLNYSLFYNENAATGFNNLQMHGGLGYALQTGFDYWVDDHWGVNLDVKKIWLNVDAKLNDGAIRADVDLDPWVVGAGVSYRF